MVDRDKIRRNFSQLTSKDRDLTMFTVTNLALNEKENSNMVYMTLKLKRKVVTELLTTYLPTILLLLITLVTIFFDKDLFSEVIAVNQGWPYCTESLMGGGVPKIITVWHGRVGV